MTSTYHKQRGVATLVVTSIILFLVTIASFYTARAVLTEQQVVNNAVHHEQAYQMAQAGLDYAQGHMIWQGTAVADATVLTGSVSGGGTYSVTISHVGGNNEIVQFTSVGTSADGQVNKTLSEKSMLIGNPGLSAFNTAIKSTGIVDINGTSTIINLSNDETITSGGTTAIGGNSTTVLSSGVSSDKNTLAGDVNPNDPILAATTDADLFDNHFGMAITDFQPIADSSFSSSGNTNYNTQLNGKLGETIWIDAGGGTVDINSSTVVGSSAQPVTIVVNNGDLTVEGSAEIYGTVITSGEYSMAGNSEVYGIVYASGDSSITGSSIIEGGLIIGGDLDIRISGRIKYVQANIQSYGSGGGTEYSRLTGSWKDF
ncbi:MAG: hypothetical protein P1U40_00225 [Coxiellaceae bacterium]|nr:hypothetical protein [Coxiellaceae bacterium]